MTLVISDFDPVRLYEAVRAGDAAAEEELVARFQPRIRTFLSMRTSERDAIEELGQEIIVAVLCALRESKLREPKQLSSFVYGTAQNVFNDYLRKRSREKLHPVPLDEDFPAPGPVLDDDKVLHAHREIDALDPGDRKILQMSLVEGFKAVEIASTLGLTPDAVRQRKSRALKRLIERLHPVSHSGPPLPLS